MEACLTKSEILKVAEVKVEKVNYLMIASRVVFPLTPLTDVVTGRTEFFTIFQSILINWPASYPLMSLDFKTYLQQERSTTGTVQVVCPSSSHLPFPLHDTLTFQSYLSTIQTF